jgi:hypothetical protein
VRRVRLNITGDANNHREEKGMKATMRMRWVGLALAGALATAASFAGAAEEAKTPDGTIEFSGGSVAAGIGFSWGSGTLTYKGKQHPISVEGLSVGSVGANTVSASGKVYNLKKIEDFDGNYAAVGTGATVGGGGGIASMRNQNGVVIDVVSTSEGVKFTIGTAGVKFALKK